MDYFLSAACYTAGKGFSPPGLGMVIDWGYKDNGAYPVNMCINAMLVNALSDVASWAGVVGDAAAAARYSAALRQQTILMKQMLQLPTASPSKATKATRATYVGGTLATFVGSAARAGAGSAAGPAAASFDASKLGFHAAALVLRSGLLDGSTADAQRQACCAFIKSTLASFFPINKQGARLSDPSKRSDVGFYTPYFQTFTFDGMFRAGEADWILEQYQVAWGWALTQSSTWLEVFDPRWEVIHSWGGCPTWQLSQYGLGLSPRFDVGPRHFDLSLHVGQSVLTSCAGVVPARGSGGDGGPVKVSWQRSSSGGSKETNGVELTLTVSAAVLVQGWPGTQGWHQVNPPFQTVLVTNFA